MASLVLIFFLLLQLSRYLGNMPDIRTINLKCSSLRDGDRYRIQTEATVDMNITLCEQHWSIEKQNESHAVAYYPKQDIDISSPVAELTAREIWLEKCANLTLVLHCHQVTRVRFSVNLDDGQEEKATRGFICTVVGGSIGALAVILLLVLAVGCRYRVRRPCGNEAVVGPQSDQLQGGAEAGDGIL